MMIPPPTPKSALNAPAATPIASSRATLVSYEPVEAEALAQIASDPAQAAVLLDVDGTLAPIVARPELAAVPENTRGQLRRLVTRYALVAFVSGRTGADARALIGVDGAAYVGVHGLELAPEAGQWRSALRPCAG